MRYLPRTWLGIVITLLFFYFVYSTLPHYGMNEDSPFHFMRGQAYLQKILTGKPTFNIPNLPSPVLFIPGQRISYYKPNAAEKISSSTPIRLAGLFQVKQTLQEMHKNVQIKTNRRNSYYIHNLWSADIWDVLISMEYPAVSDILMAISNRVFFGSLGVVGDIEGYHLYVVFVTSLSIYFLYRFVEVIYGRNTAVFSALALAFYPFLFAESHFNIKDPPQMSFFTIALVSFYFFIRYNFRIRWYLIWIFATFLALGTKWNIVSLPVIIGPWLLLFAKGRGRLFWVKVGIFGAIGISASTVLLIFTWPFLWTDTFARLVETIFSSVKLSTQNTTTQSSRIFLLPLGINATELLRIIAMTPPFHLFLLSLGIIELLFGAYKKIRRENLLILVWLLFPIIHASRQGIAFGSLRNFLEFLPAFSIIIGIGAAFILRHIERYGKRYIKNTNVLFTIFVIINILFFSIPLVKAHPNENLYYNALTNGLSGAQNNKLYTWQGSYDNPYKQAVQWANKNLPKHAKIAYLDGTMLSISPLWLRDDLAFGSFFSSYDQKGEYIISLVYPTPPFVFQYHYLNRFLEPIYTVSVDGVPIVKIWKNSPLYLKSTVKNQTVIQTKNQPIKYSLRDRKVWDLDLNGEKTITRIITTVPVTDCQNVKGIWSTILKGKETFWSLENTEIEPGRREIDFPAVRADILRYWDLSDSACLYKAHLDTIKIIK